MEDSQTLVRVTTSDPVRMNDIDYDGMYINANGRYVIRLIYKERTLSPSAVWHKALINFGELDQYIDFSNSYVFGRDGKTKYTFDPVKGVKGRGFDVASAVGDRTNGRKNLPINLVLKDGVKLETLGKKNYIIQMRLCDDDYKRVYAYAPGKSSMDYSTYTKTTSVSLEDNLNNLFIKGGYQEDSNNATSQEFFMSEFIANPDRYKDASNLGIIRTQYMGQTSTIVRETVGGEPIAFTQVFDSNLLNYLKADEKGNVGYVRLLTVAREESNYAQDVGIKLDDFNKIKVDNGQELAYLVFATPAYKTIADKKDPKVKVVEIPKNDQYTMLSGNYITGIDYVVDKSKFEDTFAGRTTGIDKTRKLDYSTMSGWTNPNEKGWLVYEKAFDNDYVVQEGDSFMVDAGKNAKGKQIMIQVGGEQAILRRPQGYYNGYATSKSALDAFEEIADGVFQFTIGEGTTVKSGKSLKIYMPYTSSFEGDGKINFLQIHNGTKLNEGAANLTLQKDRNINMHLYKQGKKGYYILKYTLKNGTDSSLRFDPNFTWTYNDKDGVMTGAANKATLPSGGNFYIDTTMLMPGKDIIVESYGADNQEIESEKSWFKYIPLNKSPETVKLITWTDHSDKRSVLSINKSLYTPYQVLFTNDYADGNAYKDPRVVPANVTDFNTDTTKIVGYTKYDSGKVRTLYEGDKLLFGKVEADGNEYDKDGNLTKDLRKPITIAKKDIFDAQFTEDSKEYKAYEYTVDLTKMLPYHSDDKTETKLTLLKDMKFVSTASDGSSLPSDLFESRVRARVLFDATDGAWTEDNKEVKKAVKIVPDNDKFYGEKGYAANGFEGANADTNTGDKFPEAPTLTGKNFLGWVTEEGKTKLGANTASVEDFNKLPKDQVFTNTTPVTKHLVVYAIYSTDTVVTFDANGGTFEGGKDELTVKADGGSVTKPAEPTRDGYKFLGWADSKDATDADPNALTNVTASKTVYAVWEQKADNKLTLNAPENPVPVSDKTDLTNKEKDAVKQAVIDANPTLNLTKDDITVGSDGKVSVTKDDKTGEIPADKTVKQKEVINNINPPAPPVEVKNPDALDDTDKGKVKDAIIKANPDLNLKPDEVTVDEKGNVTIEQGGKTGKVPADKTVVKADNVLKLEAPEKVEVKDPNNLTKAERDKVAKAVKDANGTLSNTAEIKVDANGNVTVTDGKKKGELAGTDTVKPFDRTGKTLNDPESPVEVSNLNKLTENEKDEVREAVKAANPDLHFKDEEIQVADDGTVTVPMGNETKTIDPSKTVTQDDTNKTISLKAPTKTKVKDKSSLTEKEKNDVIEAVKKANTTLPADAKIEVADDGSVTVTSGTEPNQKVGLLSQKDAVEEILKAPVVSAKEDGSVTVKPADDQAKKVEVTYTPAGSDTPTTLEATKGADGKWKLPKGTDEDITVDEITGEITLPSDKVKNGTEVKAVAKDGDRSSEDGKANASDTTPPQAPKVEAKDDGSVEITPPADKDTKTVTVTYKDPNGIEKTVTATKGDDGNWTFDPADSGLTVKDGKIVVPADKVKPGTEVSAKAKDANGNESKDAGKDNAKYVIKEPDELIKVDNSKALSDDDKAKVKKAVEDANKDGSGNSTLPEGATIDVADDGTVTIKDKNGKVVGTITPDKTVKQDENKLAVKAPTPVAVKDPANLTPEEKQAIKDAVKKANPTLQDSEIVVNDDGSVKVTKDGKERIIGKDKTISTDVKVPKLTEVANPNSLTGDEKAAVKQAVEDANKDGSGNSTLPAGSTIDVADDGTVTVKDKDGKETIIPSSNTVKEKATPGTELKDPAKVAVKDPANLTPDEKTAIKKAVKEANPTLKDSEIVVNADGSVTVTKDGSSTTIGKDKTVSTDIKVPELTEVVEPSNLEEGEKTAVKKAVEDANKDGSGNSTLPEGATITVGNDGTVTVKDKDGKETIIPASDAVTRKGGEKLADKFTPAYTEADAIAGKPSTITAPNFTDKEGKVATKPDNTTFALGEGAPTGATVDENTGEVKYTPTAADAGKTVTIPVVVKYNDGSTDKVNVTVQVAPLEIKAPTTPVTVDNAKALTPENKKAVEDAVRAKNSDLPEGATIEVADDGAVTVKDKNGKVLGTIPANKTVEQDGSKLAVKAPEAVEVANPDDVTEAEKEKIKEAIKTANPDLADATITVDDKGNVTVTKDGKSATLTPAQTIKKAGEIKAPDTPVKVKDPSKLTDDEKEAVKKAVKDANPKLPADATIDVADDGTVTVKDKDGNEIGKLKPEQTVKGVVNAPEKPVEVKDPSNLTPEEKKAVEDAVKKANPDLPEGATVEVGKDGTVTVKDKDGNVIGKLPADKTVNKRVPRPLPELYYPDTTVGIGDERTIYPIGTPGYVSEALEGIDAPRGVYVRVNPDGSISIEVSPRYSGPSIFTIRGYVYVDGILTPISINVRVEGGSRRRHNRRDDVEDEDINEDTREVYTHKAYIFGYPDGTVRPNGNVTRAEAAAMLARLLEDENTASALKPAFTDTPSHWYNRAINAALSRGVMKGYPDGTFKPNAPITRAEFTQMISQIDAKPYGEAPFADVKDHWAKLAIGKEYAAGRISGYPDGTFRPNAPITRAEAAHILNKIFDRNYDSVSAIQSEDKMNINVFGDLFTSFWGYNDMVEATNTHTFRRRVKGLVQEDWSEINR